MKKENIVSGLLVGFISAIVLLSGPEKTPAQKPDWSAKLAVEKQCGDVVHGLRFCAESMRVKVMPGEPIVLNLLIVNESDDDILLMTNRDSSKFSIVLRKLDGTVLLSKADQIKRKSIRSYEDTIELFNSSVRRHHSEVVPPGGILREQLSISRIYDIVDPGKYSVEVKRITTDSSRGNRRVEIPLKPIEIEIAPFGSKS